MDIIDHLQSHINASKDNLEVCKMQNDVKGIEYYKGLISGYEESLRLQIDSNSLPKTINEKKEEY